MTEYEYFRELISRYNYRGQTKAYGIRYTGKDRSELVITLCKPGKAKDVKVKYGIIQLKGHTSDMSNCFEDARHCIVPGKTILISGGCESTHDACKYANMNIPAFTVNNIGTGPVNDYLVLQMHSMLHDHSYAETIRRMKENAPLVMSEYTYPN